MSYGTPIEMYSLAGMYAGQVLRGENRQAATNCAAAWMLASTRITSSYCCS